MHLLKILRDPAADPATATPAAPAQAATGPQIVTPQNYGGGSQHQLWEDPYADPKIQAALNPQPPTDPLGGNKTPVLGEGGIPAPGAQAAGPGPDASSTAAAPAPGAAEPQKGAWSPDDLKYWETKDPAFKELPFHPTVQKMATGYRELETTYNRAQDYLKTVNSTMEDFRQVLASGDPAEIAKVVQHFGGDVQFDVRKPAEIVKEISDNYAGLVEVLKSVQHELPPEAIPVLNRALNALSAQHQSRIDKIQRSEEIREQVRKMTNPGAPTKVGNPYERYQAPAKANMTALEREMNDPNFWKYYEAIAPEFKEGGRFHALGLTAGKAFGVSIDSARQFMDMAKAMWTLKNMDKEILPAFEKTVLAKAAGNGAVTAPPKGAAPAAPGNPSDKFTQQMEGAMEQHMSRRRTL